MDVLFSAAQEQEKKRLSGFIEQWKIIMSPSAKRLRSKQRLKLSSFVLESTWGGALIYNSQIPWDTILFYFLPSPAISENLALT